MTEVERLRRADEVVQSALERDAEEQAAFLDVACAGDPSLRAEVESLLGYRERARDFIESPAYVLNAGLLVDGDDADPAEGRQVGPYRIVREIGRGGMGAVFLAERADGEFRQQAAVKIVGQGFGGPELARRFRRERQILASLNHPNIARLLDGGVSEKGEPYLVMEYVEGVRIDEYCDEKHLRTEDRLRLFLAVCRGVSYAHQNLIVHRDIKPSNILVTSDGVPKLLDFGIAKLLDSEHADEHTQTNFRAFTPAYASPEQVRGERVTTASDVYSLGVLLNELLRGARTSPNGWPALGLWRSGNQGRKTAAANAATNQGKDGGQESAAGRRSVGHELQNIVVMAKREEPARRYSSVAQFAEDVQRYLDGLPVRAQKDSFTYRTGKFVRRNKAAVGASALVALSLVIGLTVALWQAGVARAERDRADAQRARAERRFDDVRRLSNALLTDIAPQIEQLPGATRARQTLLAQSLTYLDSLASESGDDPSLQSELATAYEKVGDLQGNPTNPNLVAMADALASYEKANAMRRRLLEKDPGDFEQRRLLANNYRALGDIRWQTNEPTEALKNSEAALSLYGELLAERPGSAELRLALARTHLDVGKSLATNEKFSEAISSFRKAAALLAELRRGQLGGADISRLLVESHKQMGNALSWDGRQEEAEAEMARAVALSESLVAANPNDAASRTALYQTYMMTSSVYEEQNDTLSNEYAFKALSIIEGTVGSDPANLRAKQQLAKTYSRLGVTLNNVGKSRESVVYLGKAVTILREIAQKETKNRRFRHDLATAFIRLGDSKYKQRDFRGSIKDLEQAAAVLTELVETDPSDNASLRNLANAADSLAKAHEQLAERQAALRNYRRALNSLRQLEARDALSNYDRKSLEEMQAVIQKYEQGK